MSKIAVQGREIAPLAAAYLAGRDAYIAARREPLIQKAMRRSWIERRLGLKPRTRDRAIEHLSNGDPFGKYRLLDLHDLGTVCHVDGLQHVSPEKTVMVSVSVYRRLIEFSDAMIRARG